MDRRNGTAQYVPNELQYQHALFGNTGEYVWPQVVYYSPPSLPAYLMSTYYEMARQSNGSVWRPGRVVVLENSLDNAMWELLDRLPRSDVGARPPWRLDPFLGTWPRPRSDDIDAPRWPWFTKRELRLYRHRKREERARSFDDDEEFVPCISPKTDPPMQGTAAPAVIGVETGAFSSSLLPPDASRSRKSKAIPIRRPEDGTIVKMPGKASSSHAIPIMRPDGTAVTPPHIGRDERPVPIVPRAPLGRVERREQPPRLIQPTLQAQKEAETSRRAPESQGNQGDSDDGSVTPRAASPSTATNIRVPAAEADRSNGSPVFTYVKSPRPTV
ncbi:hypothetical protein VP1G_06597 [Cytospora mali]|uniref:Uncharacterized protein n=1 Tax=Cytospora mali TaxID=578113 RepID=A0A194V606_CYTMA|nr:hypothetical protein VP1G_06597 [Valsa mali var. pyri (nom. inval.)]